MQAMEFAEMVKDKSIALETAIHWHLTANHYPPVPVPMVDVCCKAVRLAKSYYPNECHLMVRLPDGVSYKGMSEAPVQAIIDGHHLEVFV